MQKSDLQSRYEQLAKAVASARATAQEAAKSGNLDALTAATEAIKAATSDLAQMTDGALVSVPGKGKLVRFECEALESLAKLNQVSFHEICNRIQHIEANRVEVIFLTELNLTDISPLSKLTRLRYLNLAFNKITDLSPLSGLNRLDELTIANNEITGIEALSTLTALRSLILYPNKVDDITPLYGLTKLRELCTNGQRIKGASFGAKSLQNLRNLIKRKKSDQPSNIDIVSKLKAQGCFIR